MVIITGVEPAGGTATASQEAGKVSPFAGRWSKSPTAARLAREAILVRNPPLIGKADATDDSRPHPWRRLRAPSDVGVPEGGGRRSTVSNTLCVIGDTGGSLSDPGPGWNQSVCSGPRRESSRDPVESWRNASIARFARRRPSRLVVAFNRERRARPPPSVGSGRRWSLLRGSRSPEDIEGYEVGDVAQYG